MDRKTEADVRLEGSGHTFTMEEFAEKVRESVSDSLRSGYHVEVTEVNKNNGSRHTALLIHAEGRNIVPRICLEGFYRGYEDGEDMESICKRITDAYRENMPEGDINISFLYDFDAVKGDVYCRLMNRERNAGMLRETPHKDFLDLTIVAYLSCSVGSEDGDGVITVNSSLLDKWGITKEALFACAERNTRDKLGTRIVTLGETIAKMTGEPGGGELESLLGEYMPPIYVASNRSGRFGAAVMLDEEQLGLFADTAGGDYYILPSSIHELLFLPALCMDMEGEGELLRNMVAEVNEKEVLPEERLSNNVYFYSRERRCVELL